MTLKARQIMKKAMVGKTIKDIVFHDSHGIVFDFYVSVDGKEIIDNEIFAETKPIK